MGDMRNAYNLKGRDRIEDLGVEGRITLECILGKYGGNVRIYAFGSG
jgi:hypothetical protein